MSPVDCADLAAALAFYHTLPSSQHALQKPLGGGGVTPSLVEVGAGGNPPLFCGLQRKHPQNDINRVRWCVIIQFGFSSERRQIKRRKKVIQMGSIFPRSPGFLRDRDPLKIRVAVDLARFEIYDCGKDIRAMDDCIYTMTTKMMIRQSISEEDVTKVFGILNRMMKLLKEKEHFFNIILTNVDPDRTIITFEERCEVAYQIYKLERSILDSKRHLNTSYTTFLLRDSISYD